MKHKIIALLCTSILVACGSPSVNYYRLAGNDALDAPVSIKQRTSTQMIVTVQLPDYLNTNNIAYQITENGIALAQYHLWAEAPDTAIARLLVNDLARQRPNIVWLTGETAVSYNGPSLLIALDQFNGRHDSNVLLTGQWIVRDKGQKLVASHPINIKLIQHGDGYEAMVRSLKQGLYQLSGQIAEEMPLSVQQNAYSGMKK